MQLLRIGSVVHWTLSDLRAPAGTPNGMVAGWTIPMGFRAPVRGGQLHPVVLSSGVAAGAVQLYDDQLYWWAGADRAIRSTFTSLTLDPIPAVLPGT